MTGLCGTSTAATLVPGDPDQLDWLAREYGRYAGGACDAARALRRIDTGEWVGPAGNAFRRAIGEVPDKLERGQSAFARAAAVLSDYARVLRDAQADTAAAIRRYADGDAATARWRAQQEAQPKNAPKPDPGADPGADERLAAEHILTAARDRVETAARRAAAALDDARRGAPHEPGLLSKAVHAVGSFLAGAGEATWGLAQFAYKMSPTYALTDPEGYVKNLEDLGKGVVYGVEHPKELGKAVLDWDTWSKDPARALGHLVPDVVLALATAGTGEAGVAAGRAAEGAEAAEELATRGVRTAAEVAGLSDEEAALLEERFASPSERVLEFQGGDRYPGVDRWQDRILQPGQRFSVGSPGEGRFAATPDAVEQIGTDARRYNEGLQVASREDPVDGIARYRSHLNTYEINKPLPVGESIAEANAQFGAGGLSQYFLPDELRTLEAEGYIELASTTEMTNLEATIGPKGLSALDLVPAAREHVLDGATLGADTLTRLEGCR
ncbi:MAG: hypothetical protein QOI82_122 [Actinomycetota bacterium]|jgi:hypothetical protein|nr:hypothetical protein [Actinomycetota bacterium]